MLLVRLPQLPSTVEWLHETILNLQNHCTMFINICLHVLINADFKSSFIILTIYLISIFFFNLGLQGQGLLYITNQLFLNFLTAEPFLYVFYSHLFLVYKLLKVVKLGFYYYLVFKELFIMNFSMSSVLSLRPYKKDQAITLKVQRLWKVESSVIDGKVSAMEMILLDRQVTNMMLLGFCNTPFPRLKNFI